MEAIKGGALLDLLGRPGKSTYRTSFTYNNFWLGFIAFNCWNAC